MQTPYLTYGSTNIWRDGANRFRVVSTVQRVVFGVIGNYGGLTEGRNRCEDEDRGKNSNEHATRPLARSAIDGLSGATALFSMRR